MKLWLLTNPDPDGYELFDSCVVAAKTEAEARLIHPGGEDEYMGSWYSSWCSPSSVIVECIGTSKIKTKGVIVASYNAG